MQPVAIDGERLKIEHSLTLKGAGNLLLAKLVSSPVCDFYNPSRVMNKISEFLAAYIATRLYTCYTIFSISPSLQAVWAFGRLIRPCRDIISLGLDVKFDLLVVHVHGYKR